MKKEFCHYLSCSCESRDFSFLTADVGYRLFDELKEKLSHRFVNTGISESTLIGLAAGMASKEYKVFAFSLGPFVSLNALEQLKIDVGFDQRNVCVVSAGVGFHYGVEGITHYNTSDISLMLQIPNFRILNPANLYELEHCLNQIVSDSFPSYLRLGQNEESLSPISESGDVFEYKTGTDLAVVTSGTILSNVLESVPDNVQVMSVSNLSLESIRIVLNKLSSKRVLVIDESGPTSSLFGLVSQEIASVKELDIKTHFICCSEIGANCFGDENKMRQLNGLDVESLKTAISNIIKND